MTEIEFHLGLYNCTVASGILGVLRVFDVVPNLAPIILAIVCRAETEFSGGHPCSKEQVYTLSLTKPIYSLP